MQSSDSIITEILESIENSDLVVAEVTLENGNVYYEIGYADALKKNIILCTQKIDNTPFDLRSRNHIVYSSIVNLREQLNQWLQSLTFS